MDLILRSICSLPQMQLSMTSKVYAPALRRNDVKPNKKNRIDVILRLTRHALRKLSSTVEDQFSDLWVSSLQ
jgi:hypothetical protein